ncbi:MAG: hypothetical protein ACI3XG_04425 [Faecousia sp.]
MRKNTKRAAIACAAVVVGFFLLYLALIATAVADVPEDTAGLLVVVFVGLIVLAVVGGVLIALRQRLKEIDGGEEEDARRY